MTTLACNMDLRLVGATCPSCLLAVGCSGQLQRVMTGDCSLCYLSACLPACWLGLGCHAAALHKRSGVASASLLQQPSASVWQQAARLAIQGCCCTQQHPPWLLALASGRSCFQRVLMLGAGG